MASANAIPFLSEVRAASLALLATILTLRYPRGGGPQPAPTVSAPTINRPLAQTPNTVEVPTAHLDRLIGFCSSMVTTNRSFVVFNNGTCVIVKEHSSDPIAEAMITLGECSNPNARFITKEIEHGNILVTYQKPAFHCLFQDEIEETRSTIESEFIHYLTDAERSQMERNWEPPFQAKLGLMARQRLNEDANDLRIAKVIKARPIEPVTPGLPKAISLESPFPES